MTDTYTIGVTGGAGYTGSRLVADLLAAGHDVVPIDDFSHGQVEQIDGIDVQPVDIRDRATLREQFDGVDAICHLAAVSGLESCTDDPERAFDVNVVGTENVAWCCREWEIPLVFACSMALIGEPQEIPISAEHPRAPKNFYGRTKTMNEDDIHQLAEGAFPAHIYMTSNLYGWHTVDGQRVGKDTVINSFVERALAGDVLPVHEPGTQKRDFIHVKDVARAYPRSLARLLDADSTGATTFALASGECKSVREIAEIIQRVGREQCGLDVDIEVVPNPRGDDDTLSEEFTVDTSTAEERIGFETVHDVESAVRERMQND